MITNTPDGSGLVSGALWGFAMASMLHLNRLIDLALEEDIGTGDITTETLIPADAEGRAEIVAKEKLVRFLGRRVEADRDL